MAKLKDKKLKKSNESMDSKAKTGGSKEQVAPAKTTGPSRRGQIAKAVGAMVAGVTLGYVAGALTAPASGKETRRRIRERVDQEAKTVATRVRRTLTTAKTEAAALGVKAKASVNKAKDKLADKIHS